jgi:hypothetical membrane protein
MRHIIKRRKQKRSSITSFNLAWVFAGVTSTGLALSIALTTDPRWSHWHLSRLGEGDSLSASIFNFSLIIAAMILTWLGIKVTNEIRGGRPHKGVIILRSLLLFVAFCWVGVASFPFDKSPIIHNIFGYAQFFAVGYAMLRLKWLCPRFSERTYYIGYGAALLTGLLMALFHMTHFTTLLIVELIGQFFIYLWILSMTADQKVYLQK